VARIGETKDVYRILMVKRQWTFPLRRPGRRCSKQYVRMIGYEVQRWKKTEQELNHWWYYNYCCRYQRAT
jgi:hypothetical protein